MPRAATLPGGPPLTSAGDLDELTRRAAAGDADAFGALYDALAPGALRLLRGLGLGREQAEDALQESFLRLLRRLPALAEPGRVRGYLAGIAHHVAVDGLRRRTAAPAEAEPIDERPGAEAAALGRERDAVVAAALAALPDALRGALALRHAGGLTMHELALALDCSVPTARARLSEAASRLAVELRRRGLDPAEEVSR
ncbi:MAG: sigma-70 family RNA polymerase sigma factor [Planctomycetes bacterium]|nr:sigma-70 family RNA polymerase sigma factor [Planctomycetota bacterium]